jgi:chromosome segregation ATPase
LQYRSLQGDYLVADNAQKDWEGKYQQMSESYRRLDRSKTSLTTDFDGFKTKSAQTVSDLERQLKEMTARYEQMNTAHQAATGRVKVLETNFATLQKDFGALKVDYDSVASQNKSFTIQVAKLTGEKNALDAAFTTHKTDSAQQIAAADKQYKLLVVEKTKVEKAFSDEQAAHESTHNQWNTQYQNITNQFETEKAGHAETRKQADNEAKSLTFKWSDEQKKVANSI